MNSISLHSASFRSNSFHFFHLISLIRFHVLSFYFMLFLWCPFIHYSMFIAFRFVWFHFIGSCMRSFIHSFLLSFIHSLIESPTPWFTRTLMSSLIHWLGSFLESFMQSLIWCFNERFNQFLGSPIHTFTLHSFLHWFTQWFLESSIHWVIHSLIHSPIHVMSFHFPSLRFFSTYVMCHFIFMWFFIVRFISLQVRNGFMWLCIHSFILVMSIISLNFIHFISLHSTPFRSIPSHAFISCHVISSFSLFRSNVMSFQFS